MSTHRKVFCMFLGFLLAVSGCRGHITSHCKDMSDEIATPPNNRVNYHPILTPITDVTGECYGHVEDAAIVAVVVPALVIFVVAATIKPELVVRSLVDELVH